MLSDVFDTQLKIHNMTCMENKKTTTYRFIRLNEVFDTQLVQHVFDRLRYGKTKNRHLEFFLTSIPNIDFFSRTMCAFPQGTQP